MLAIQGDVREHAAALERCGAAAVPVRRREELAGVAGLVIPGGESTVIDKLLRAFGLREPVRARIADGLPIYGSCAGMILLADRVADGIPDQQTLGGIDMTVRRNAFGRQVDSFEVDLDIAEVTDPGRTFRAVFIRAPWVEQMGPSVQALAFLPRRVAEAGSPTARVVAVRQGALLATSFHPEVGGDDRVHAHFVDIVRDR
ncbi:MAG: pyridoxal 5'-phosphate synthase glutaminase subunit PdxT [Dermatophilaceae bacterium]